MSEESQVIQVQSQLTAPVADDIGTRIPMTIGLIIITLFFGVFGSWAMLAPLESAAIAPGVVSVESTRKTIQHLEGGIVGEIHVRDGDVIEAGAILIRLDETQPRASLTLFEGRFNATRALEARLIAERDRREAITVPKEFDEHESDPEIPELIEGQVNIFNARRQSIEGQSAIMRQRIAQIQEEINGLNEQIKAQDTQLELSNDEIESFQKLFEKGLSGKSRLRELQREFADVTGDRSRNIAAIARARQNIAEAKLQITELKTKLLNEVVQQLGDVQNELFDLNEKINAAKDILTRTDIVAPLAGTVVGLKVHTVGGVVAPGEPLLDIVPKEEQLIIEAFVDPNDIDIVESGLTAQVRLTAFSQRHMVPVEGEVITVSADRLTDERTGRDYFLARVKLLEDPSEILEGAVLYPGMQAEVMIVTGARTTFDYIIRPITQSMNRAFREN